MKHTITTIIGDFSVGMSYQPSTDDSTLNRFTDVINKHALPVYTKVLVKYPYLDSIKDSEKLCSLTINAIEEASLESALYDSTCIAGGAGVRLTLSLKNREIDLYRF